MLLDSWCRFRHPKVIQILYPNPLPLVTLILPGSHTFMISSICFLVRCNFTWAWAQILAASFPTTKPRASSCRPTLSLATPFHTTQVPGLKRIEDSFWNGWVLPLTFNISLLDHWIFIDLMQCSHLSRKICRLHSLVLYKYDLVNLACTAYLWVVKHPRELGNSFIIVNVLWHGVFSGFLVPV